MNIVTFSLHSLKNIDLRFCEGGSKLIEFAVNFYYSKQLTMSLENVQKLHIFKVKFVAIVRTHTLEFGNSAFQLVPICFMSPIPHPIYRAALHAIGNIYL